MPAKRPINFLLYRAAMGHTKDGGTYTLTFIRTHRDDGEDGLEPAMDIVVFDCGHPLEEAVAGLKRVWKHDPLFEFDPPLETQVVEQFRVPSLSSIEGKEWLRVIAGEPLEEEDEVYETSTDSEGDGS